MEQRGRCLAVWRAGAASVRLATVALANKMARIAWAVMTRSETYQAKGRAQAAASTVA